VNLNQGLVDLVAVALVAALAPLVVAVLPGPRIPQVVIFLVGGVLIGPHVLGVDPLRLLLFFVLLLIVRGLPSLLVYRRTLRLRQRAEMTFITATTLPLLIALADIGQQDGVMLPATSAALVGAGVLSVLVYPQIAVGLHRSVPLTPADAGIATAQTPVSSSPPPENTGQPGHDS
jgi:hypothetical protein